MTLVSHCRPAPLATNQVGVPRVDPTLIKMNDAVGGAGTRHGRILLLPGLGGSGNGTSPEVPVPFWEPSNGPVGGTMDSNDTFRAALNNDGWQTVQVPNLPQALPGIPSLISDIGSDSGSGLRVLNTNLLYFDHLMAYCNQWFGGPMPTFVIGMSWGAWWANELAINRVIGQVGNSSLTAAYPQQFDSGGHYNGAYGIQGAYSHCTVNSFSNVSALASPYFYTHSQSFYTGMNLGSTALNNVTIPMRVTWAWRDIFITTSDPPTDCITMVTNANQATGGTTSGLSTPVGASVGASNTSFTGSGSSLNVADTSSFLTPPVGLPTIAVLTTGGVAMMTYNGITAGAPGTLNNVTNITGLFNGTIVAAGSGGYVNGTIANGSGITTGSGLVTGLGITESHNWDYDNVAQNYDSVDCLYWFANTIDPHYPQVF